LGPRPFSYCSFIILIGLGCNSSGVEPAYQAGGPDVKYQLCIKKKEKRRGKGILFVYKNLIRHLGKRIN
jgi:hypothetical protein